MVDFISQISARFRPLDHRGKTLIFVRKNSKNWTFTEKKVFMLSTFFSKFFAQQLESSVVLLMINILQILKTRQLFFSARKFSLKNVDNIALVGV